MVQPVPYLFFNGACRAAMTAYGEVFGAAPEIVGFDQLPPDEATGMREVPADAVMHAALKVGDGWIYASDDVSPGGGPAMAGVNIHVSLPSMEKARQAFDALAEGGEVRMKLEPSFWSPGFGALTDRFGTRWMISVDGPPQAG